MARRSGVVLTGDDELDRRLGQFEPKVQKAMVRKATRKAAKLVLDKAREYAPFQFGELEASLHVRSLRRRDRRRGAVGHSVITSGDMFVGETYYGGFLEFGTGLRQHKSGKAVGQINKGDFDFLRPALYETEAEARQLFRKTLHALILAERPL